MSSVLVVKLEAEGQYSSDGILKAFREHYDEVYEFDWQKARYNMGVEEMRKRLMGMAMMHRPEVIFLHIQIDGILDRNTLEFLQKEIGYVVFYTFDVREDIQWIKDLAPYMDLILFGDQQSIQECKKAGIDHVGYLQSSADFDLYKPHDGRILGVPDIVFIGNNTYRTALNHKRAKERVQMVEFLQAEYHDGFGVFGMGWTGTKMVSPKDEIKLYSGCKIAITQNQFFRPGYSSDRLWRAIGCGALTVSEYYDGYYDDFPDYETSQTWYTLEDLKERCDILLQEDVFRKKIADKQRSHVLHYHSWNQRIYNLKKLIEYHGKRNNEPVEDIATS